MDRVHTHWFQKEEPEPNDESDFDGQRGLTILQYRHLVVGINSIKYGIKTEISQQLNYGVPGTTELGATKCVVCMRAKYNRFCPPLVTLVVCNQYPFILYITQEQPTFCLSFIRQLVAAYKIILNLFFKMLLHVTLFFFHW